MKLNEEQKKLKEQLKLEHRDRLVALGVAAVEHAVKGLDPMEPRERERLALLRAELLILSTSHKYLSSIVIQHILTRAHCCVDLEKQQSEIHWQSQNSDPEIEKSFTILRDAENQLKKKHS